MVRRVIMVLCLTFPTMYVRMMLMLLTAEAFTLLHITTASGRTSDYGQFGFREQVNRYHDCREGVMEGTSDGIRWNVQGWHLPAAAGHQALAVVMRAQRKNVAPRV